MLQLRAVVTVMSSCRFGISELLFFHGLLIYRVLTLSAMLDWLVACTTLAHSVECLHVAEEGQEVTKQLSHTVRTLHIQSRASKVYEHLFGMLTFCNNIF